MLDYDFPGEVLGMRGGVFSEDYLSSVPTRHHLGGVIEPCITTGSKCIASRPKLHLLGDITAREGTTTWYQR